MEKVIIYTSMTNPVKLFQTTIDGVVFGLVPDAENETVELQPSSTIAFQSPWDGEYDT
jgi:hypothetical protein